MDDDVLTASERAVAMSLSNRITDLLRWLRDQQVPGWEIGALHVLGTAIGRVLNEPKFAVLLFAAVQSGMELGFDLGQIKAHVATAMKFIAAQEQDGASSLRRDGVL